MTKSIHKIRVVAFGVSMMAAFFVAASSAAAATLFSDGFESGDFSVWDTNGVDWHLVNSTAPAAHTGTYRAEGRGNALATGSILEKFVSLSGYTAGTLTFWYKLPGSGFEVDEDMTLEVTLDGGLTWDTVAMFSDGDEIDEWTEFMMDLPMGTHNNSDFGFRFVTNADAASDIFALDDVAVMADLIQPEGEIIAPEADAIVTGEVELVAVYEDFDGGDNDDIVQWAVRAGTCAAGAGNVFGNVGGLNDAYDWDGSNFSATVDTTGLTPGMYCFVFNPKDDAGQNDVRETREFFIASDYVSVGGQIIEEKGSKRKDWLKVSLGGWVADIGELVGDLTVQFHNVGNNAFDGGTFHATDIKALSVVDGSNTSCTAAMNFVAHGEYNGEAGWSVVVRAGDSDNAASKDPDDTLRVQLFNMPITTALNAGHVYDTHAVGEFSDESNCVGTARTGMDAGNVEIVMN